MCYAKHYCCAVCEASLPLTWQQRVIKQIWFPLSLSVGAAMFLISRQLPCLPPPPPPRPASDAGAVGLVPLLLRVPLVVRAHLRLAAAAARAGRLLRRSHPAGVSRGIAMCGDRTALYTAMHWSLGFVLFYSALLNRVLDLHHSYSYVCLSFSCHIFSFGKFLCAVFDHILCIRL